MKTPLSLLLSTAALTCCLVGTACSDANSVPELQTVASFDHQVTGVAVAKQNRIFVNFPRWTEDAPISVGEVMTDGSVKPFPDAAWNAWRNAEPDALNKGEHFICVQSVVLDHANNLWVVDAGAPGNDKVLPGAPKLVKIDLAANEVAEIILFDEKEVPAGSYLNDIRFSPDDKYAYLTDSGRGAIVVVDLVGGKTRRLLEKDPSVMAEKGVVPHADGKELRRADGRAAVFHSDGLALSADGSYLYWQALTGKTLYRIPTIALRDEALSTKALKAKVEKVGENGVADGLWIDKNDQMYITAPEENAVKLRVGTAAPRVLMQDARLRWPDSFAEGPQGAIYVTSSHIQDSPWFKPGADKAVKTELWKIAQ